jgi:hypothetical protein
MNFRGIWLLSGAGTPELLQSQIPFSVIALSIPILSLTAIFLYKKRRLQMKFTIGVIFLDIILIMYLIFFAYLIINRYHVEFIPFINMIIPPLVLILSILAYIRIKKDENLVRSYDRLR